MHLPETFRAQLSAVAVVVFLCAAGVALAYNHRPPVDRTPIGAPPRTTNDEPPDPGVVAERKTPVVMPVGRATRVLFVGDSLRLGSFAKTRRSTYVAQIRSALAKAGRTRVQEFDAKSYGDADRGRRAAEVRGIPSGMDMAFVEMGTNDYTLNDPDRFAVDYRRLLVKVRRASPRAKLFCFGIWRPASALTTSMNDTISDECSRLGGRYIAISDLFANHHGPAGIKTFRGTSDDFHPNTDGHRLIAISALDAIRVRR